MADPTLHIPTVWPSGYYALPKTRSGCPKSRGFKWMEGVRYQRLYSYTAANGDFPANSVQKLEGLERKAAQSFCSKDRERGSKLARDWPPGSYCIYRLGGTCPVSEYH